MPIIKILDEITANKIAAGEVVERPASVVKELLENALDAGSTVINIDIFEGGSKIIKVTDNGCGLNVLDVPLAFQRHATSKISSSHDLDNISTLGFRGEALPSIASVAKVSMTTRANDDIVGISLTIHGGKQIELKEVGCPTGTTIIVEDLFFNTPARKKHLKSLNVEAGHISDIVGRLAMAYPEVAFHLTHNQKNVLQTPGTGKPIDAVAAIYGLDIAKELLSLSYQDEVITVQGFLAKPIISRSSRNHQSLYINHRYIRSRLISEAIEEGYHTLLNIGRHPLFIMNLFINPELVDVNVHPTKMEVRFSSADKIREIIVRAVRETLISESLIPEVKLVPKKQASKIKYEQEKIELNNFATNVLQEKPDYQYVAEKINETRAVNSDDIKINIASAIQDDEQKLPYMEPIGQIDATFIIAQGESGMYLIDQHAAHERILYEKFMDRSTEIVVQELLVPITVELTNLESQFLINNILLLTDLGFQIEHFGGDTFLIRAVPQLLPHNNEKSFFLDLLDSLSAEKKSLSANEIKESILITMACKAAIKANHRLSKQEMVELLKQLQNAKNPYTCPHGRPTVIYTSAYELAKKFKRVM